MMPWDIGWVWARTAEREKFEALISRINSSRNRMNVVFDPPGNDVEIWLQKIGFILSTSDFESFHMAVGEGIASGAFPIIRSWEDADNIWKGCVLHQDTSQASSQIKFFQKHQEKFVSYKQMLRNECLARYDLPIVASKIADLLLEGKSKPGSQKKPVGIQKITKCLVFWAIGDFDVFHRKEMIEALAANLRGEVDIWVIEPGTHKRTILENNSDSQENIERYENLEPRKHSDNLYVFKCMEWLTPTSYQNLQDFADKPPKNRLS